MKSIVPVLIATLASLGAQPTTAREGVARQSVGCVFCSPQYIAVDPDFVVVQRSPHVHEWDAYAGTPFTRFDIEGIRRLTRMP